MTDRIELERILLQACLMEVRAKKAGNVHPQASFGDVTFDDFAVSAEIVAPILAAAADVGVGRTILEAVQATRRAVGSNTNLGMLLLLAPLAAVPADEMLSHGIRGVLERLTLDDARDTYEAIRLAHPGGMGSVENGDITEPPPIGLIEAMTLAKERDLIAAEYADGFPISTGSAARMLSATTNMDWELRVIHLHLSLIARYSDSLIERKCGPDVADQARSWAQHIFAEGWPETDGSIRLFDKFDRWLRADGNRRNPGSTADLVAATIFVCLRDGLTTFPDWNP
jgi:triphosphoribosyl-dephospho-CoA synthase